MKQKIYLVDAPAYFFRSYFALPSQWFDQEGRDTSAVYGFMKFVFGLLQQLKPQYLAMGFDESLGSCFRNELCSNYKQSRPLPDVDIIYQFEICKQLLDICGIKHFSSARYEADDLLGSLATDARADDTKICFLTRDKDYSQLLSGDDVMWDYPKAEPLGVACILAKYGVTPLQFADWLALTGDSADDIKGVSGVGPRTASQILKHYGSVAQLLARLDELPSIKIRSAMKIKKALEENPQQLETSVQLTRICSDLNLVTGKNDLCLGPCDYDDLVAYLDYLGLASLTVPACLRVSK